MNTIVIEAQQCPNCGRLMAGGALAGLCPACLLAQGTAEAQPAAPKPPFVPPPIEEIRKLFPQLEIESVLGSGGMGAVYKARQPALDRWVALKVLPAENSSGVNFAERFNREARALARLSHPNIVAVHEFGLAGALHYFLMEFVDGANLRQLEQAGRLSAREALQIIPQICDALQYAHDEGVVHRDIKPENVLVDRKGRVKIADFGLAKILGATPESQRLTMEGQVMGTPHYMAPEQVEKPLAVDHRADIYALGVVFYEMLTGDLPLGKFAPPSRKVQIDLRLDDVVLRALENDPERRYQKASHVKDQLDTIATSAGTKSQPSQSSQPSQTEERPLYWAAFPLATERNGQRRKNRKERFRAWAIIFGLLTIVFAFVTALTGRSLMGWLGILGSQSLMVRAIVAALVVMWGTRKALEQPALSPGAAATKPNTPWWRSKRVVIASILLVLLTWTIFRERPVFKAPPGTRDADGVLRPDIKVSQIAVRDPETGRLTAHLPGRGTAELLGVGETNAALNGWWSADGSPLRDVEYNVPNPIEEMHSGRISHDFLFRVRDLPAGAAQSGIHTEPSSGVGSGAMVMRDGKPLADAFHVRCAWRSSVRKANIQLGFAVEAWRTISTISGVYWNSSQTRQHGDPFWRVQFHDQPKETADGAQVSVIIGPETRMWVHQVVAVDTNGVEHTQNNARGSIVDKITLWTYTFNKLRLADIQEFRVQVRPVYWVEFKNIALAPREKLPAPRRLAFDSASEIQLDGVIDFETGSTQPVSTPVRDVVRHGWDTTASNGELHPLDMEFVQLKDDEWETLGVAELRKRVYGNWYHPSIVKPEGTRTYGFRTREHGAGILQFLDADDSKSVKLRYKMVKPIDS